MFVWQPIKVYVFDGVDFLSLYVLLLFSSALFALRWQCCFWFEPDKGP